MNEREPMDEPQATDEGEAQEVDSPTEGPAGVGMREGLDREYASMGTGEAGGGVGGGGASSSDVEWDEGVGDPLADPDAEEPREELTSGGAMTNEQDFVDDET
jgi:hypothetical protein